MDYEETKSDILKQIQWSLRSKQFDEVAALSKSLRDLTIAEAIEEFHGPVGEWITSQLETMAKGKETLVALQTEFSSLSSV